MRYLNFLLACIGACLLAKSTAALPITLSDTIVFDLSQSTFTNESGTYYIEFPIYLNSDDVTINAVDFWFQFDQTKLTYVSTNSLIIGFDPFTNFNTNNQYLSNTSSTPSISDYLPLNTNILTLKFALAGACTDILPSDFFSITTLINGIVSSSQFIPQNPGQGISIGTPNAACPGEDVQFSFGTEINGQTITTYAWDFGNGQTSNQQNASTTYSSGQEYTATLTATTLDGCTYNASTPVQIYPKPTADFSTTYVSSQNQIQFNNLSSISSGTITTYDWSFGDSNSSSLSDPLHQYPASGNYTCILIVTSDFGCRDTTQQVVFQPLSVDDLNINSALLLWPNPANGLIHLQAATTNYFGIYNSAGDLVVAPFLIGAGQTWNKDITGLSDGMYFVRPMNKPSDHSVKFLVK